MIEKVTLVNLPPSIGGFLKITAEPEGDYPTVVANARWTHEANRKTCEHENEHFENDDFSKEGTVDFVEKVRHS